VWGRGRDRERRITSNVGDEKEMRKTGSRALRDKRRLYISDGCRQT